MLNGLIRLIVLGILAIAAAAVFFLVLHIVIRLVVWGAIVLAVLFIIKNWNRGTSKSD